MRHLVLLLSTASAQVRIQYPFGAGPVVVQCPSGDITITCGEAALGTAPASDDPTVAALRQQVAAMEARIARLVDEAGKASVVTAAVSATGYVEAASRSEPAPSSAAAELWPPPSAAESALLSRLELTPAQLYSSADLDLSSRHLDDSDSRTLAALLAARGATGLRALRRLWLSENRIGDEGAAAILAALQAAGGLHGLTALYLTNNQLGPPAARALADALGGGGGGNPNPNPNPSRSRSRSHSRSPIALTWSGAIEPRLGTPLGRGTSWSCRTWGDNQGTRCSYGVGPASAGSLGEGLTLTLTLP